MSKYWYVIRGVNPIPWTAPEVSVGRVHHLLQRRDLCLQLTDVAHETLAAGGIAR